MRSPETRNNVVIKELTIKEFASPVGTPGTIGMPGNASLTQGINWTIKNCEILLNHGMGVRVAFGMQIIGNQHSQQRTARDWGRPGDGRNHSVHSLRNRDYW